MRVILLLLFLLNPLVAKSQESCYTVQLVSVSNSKKNLKLLQENVYPDSCKLMEIGTTLTVRCSCFERVARAQEEQSSLKKEYAEAVVATTYKYRFDTNNTQESLQTHTKPLSKKKNNRAKKEFIESDLSSDDSELRLMLQVFLAKTDLENAYKVATLGFKQNPNSYYWNQKMAEVCRWTNRPAQSIQHLRFMYEKRYDPQIEQELIDYGTAYYQYEEIEPLIVNRALRNPTEENIDAMILVYKEIGEPEKVVAVLESEYKKEPTNKMLLTKALRLSLEIGDLELMKKYATMIESSQPYSKEDAYLVARYYYIVNEIPKAYEALFYIDETNKDESARDIQYYQLKSDLGWYLQDSAEAAIASKYLMDRDEARLVDYERVSFYYKKDNPKLAALAVKLAYKKSKLSYLFYSYANEALNLEQFDELSALIEEMQSDKTSLADESLYWIIKSKLYVHYKKSDLENSALHKALELDPNNYQIKLTLLWFFMNNNDSQNVKMILQDMVESGDSYATLYLPMASGYFYLQDINRASYYTEKLSEINSPITKLLEFKFLQAYIYQIQNNEEAFMLLMREILAALKAEAKKNPELKKEDKYLSNYLRAGMYIWDGDKFAKRLKKAKKHLKKENYDEISYSWALKNNSLEKSFKIYYKMERKELWVRFSNALNKEDHTKIENLLDLYLDELSLGDAAQAAYKDGQKALSQTITYEGFVKNDDSQNLYIQHRDLSKERGDLFDAKFSYLNRDPLLQNSLELQNRTYLNGAYYLYGGLNYSQNETLAKEILPTVPAHLLKADVGLRKMYDRGYIEGHLSFYDAMRSYMGYSLFGNYKMSTDLSTNVAYKKNTEALEGTQLLLGGKKDMLSLNLLWQILDSTVIDLLYEFNEYTSQDEVNLGDGKYARASIYQKIREGYPDMRVGLFYDYGIYKEKNRSKALIDELQKAQYAVLPQSFYDIGLNFTYGMANSEAYTRVWRPYFELYPYYNSYSDDFTYGLNVGYGGKVWNQDHMVLGASYTNSVNGVGGEVFELFLKYQFIYMHP